MTTPSLRSSVLLAFCATTAIGSSAVLYNESISGQVTPGTPNGDFSLLLSPTDLGDLSLGDNTVIGTTNSEGVTVGDFFSFNVPVGMQLTHFYVDDMGYAFDSNGQERFQFHFIAFDDGVELSFVQPGNTSLFASLIEAAEVEVANGAGTPKDLLVDYGNGGQYGAGLTAPLSAGTYNVFFQETSGTPITYEFRFVTQQIPEPSVSLLSMFSLLSLAGYRRRPSRGE